MSHVLYETNYQLPSNASIPFLVFFVFLSFFLKEIKASRAEKAGCAAKSGTNHRFQIGFLSFSLPIIIFVCIFFVCRQADFYKTVTLPYREGQYETVEGYVENFDPMPYGGHDTESFDIDGVHFEYSVGGAYSCYNSSVGVITGNGQHLRIRYIYYGPENMRCILYIEELGP